MHSEMKEENSSITLLGDEGGNSRFLTSTLFIKSELSCGVWDPSLAQFQTLFHKIST